MASIVSAFGSSHSVMLTCTLRDWQQGFLEHDPAGRFFDRAGNAISYRELLALAPANAAELVSSDAIATRHSKAKQALLQLKARIDAARLDVLIVIGDDQNELFSPELMPAFAIYLGTDIRNGSRSPVAEKNWYKRAQMQRLEETSARAYPCHQPLAQHLTSCLMKSGFDVAAMSGLREDQYEGHAFSFVHRFCLMDRDLPIVPVFLNTFYPPNQPSPSRCIAIGTALRQAIAEYCGTERIGILASGGLSHFQVEEDIDRRVIELLRTSDLAGLAGLDERRLQSGSSEIRNWLVLGGAATDLGLEWVSYTPAYRTPALTGTGLCFAAWAPR